MFGISIEGNARLTRSVSCPSLTEQDEHCSREEKVHPYSQALCPLGIHIFLHSSPQLETARAAEPAWLPLTSLGRCEAKDCGLESPKRKKRPWAGVRVKKPATTAVTCHFSGAAGRAVLESTSVEGSKEHGEPNK